MKIATADSWFSTQTLDDRITYICEPHIKTFYRCNIWHVRGRERDLLVDTGMGVVSLREQIPLLTERSLVAVASHTHFDHIGGHHEFEERVVHAGEAELLSRPTRENTLAGLYVKDEIFTALPPAPYRSATYGVRGAPATRIVEDGDIIDLGDRVFSVVHTPGHSPGHASYLHRDSGTLITGDAIFNVLGRRWPPSMVCHNIALTRRTAHRLAELEYRTAAFTHGPEITEAPREAIRRFLVRKG